LQERPLTKVSSLTFTAVVDNDNDFIGMAVSRLD